jgi:hypothetical protein
MAAPARLRGPTVTITAPTGGSIAIPFPATGTVTNVTGNLQGVGYLVMPGPGNILSIPAGNILAIQGGFSWSFQLTAQDCPGVGGTYTLTVFAGDNSGVGSDAKSFVRGS